MLKREICTFFEVPFKTTLTTNLFMGLYELEIMKDINISEGDGL